jgi:adhesin transport system outer membrane protein
MNFEEIVKKSINYHPSVKMSEEALKMSEEELNSAMWQYFPTPSVDYSNSTRNSEVIARLEQPLWTGGRLSAQYDIAVSAKAEAEYTIEENKLKLIEKVLDLLQSYSQAKSSEISFVEGYSRLSKFSEMIDRRVDAGVSSEGEKNLLNARLIQIKTEILNAKSKQTLTLKQLSLLVGEKIENIDFTLNKFNFENSRVDSLIDDMIKFHPTLNKFEEEIKSSIYQISKEKSTLYPTVSVIAEHKVGDVYTESVTNRDNLIYLSLKASTGAGLSLFSNIEKAKINSKRIILERDTKEKELIDSLVIDYNNMLLVKDRLVELKENQKFANEVFESNKRLFLTSKKQWLDLVNSSKELMDVSASFMESKESYNILKYKIALRTGLIDINSGEYNPLEKKSDIEDKKHDL